jgi:hypothetical protein
VKSSPRAFQQEKNARAHNTPHLQIEEIEFFSPENESIRIMAVAPLMIFQKNMENSGKQDQNKHLTVRNPENFFRSFRSLFIASQYLFRRIDTSVLLET